MTTRALFSAAVLLSVSCFAAHAQEKPMTADLEGAGGAKIGTITVTDAPKGVVLRVEAKGLAPGWHGIHFHEKGDCSDPKFMNSGAHVHTATPVVHGLLNKEANDWGDLPNIYVGADGSVETEFYSTYVSLKGEGGRAPLIDADGSAVVIHEHPDDYQTQPIGGAGARIACAVIK